MHRCLELAALGAGRVAPNPMVGAVLVHNQRILGEGYHRQYGQPHAEVNCLAAVQPADQHLMEQATMYVSLEPCAHFGKTPPCADLILQHRIPRVVIACRDPFPAVDGKGMEKLKAGGVEVVTGVMEKEGRFLNRRFFHFHEKKRPWVILKWAQSANGCVAEANRQPMRISHPLTDRLVHRWRSEEAAIAIGSHTAGIDNPSLTTRLWPGKNPTRVVFDRSGTLEKKGNLFSAEAPTLVLEGPACDPLAAMEELYRQRILSILVEGGPLLQQSFIDAGCWDEIRIITNQEMVVPEGYAAPQVRTGHLWKQEIIGTDRIEYYHAAENILPEH